MSMMGPSPDREKGRDEGLTPSIECPSPCPLPMGEGSHEKNGFQPELTYQDRWVCQNSELIA
jgi:hypothetical protein